MKHHIERWPLAELIAALLGFATPKTAGAKPVKRKPRPRHRHAAFLELP